MTMKADNANQAIEKFLLRINRDLKKTAEQIAKNEDRSFNSYIVTLVKNDIQSKQITA